jgi:hypothetical protein
MQAAGAGPELDRDLRCKELEVTSPAQWEKNFTINPHDADSDPVPHPYNQDNKDRLVNRLTKTSYIPLVPVEPEVYSLRNEAFRDGIPVQKITTDAKTGKPLKTAADIMWNAGYLAGAKYKTLDLRNGAADVGPPVEAPLGTAVLEPLAAYVPVFDRAAQQLERLFDYEKKRPTLGFSNPPLRGGKCGKTFLGYNPNKRGPRGGRNFAATLADILFYLPEELADFVVAYCKGLAMIIGCSYDCIPQWTVILIEYADGSGFMFHIDGITDFGNYPGFIFNLSLAYFGDQRAHHPKFFDMIDLSTASNVNAVRFRLQQYQTHAMSGTSRIYKPHGVPKGPSEKKFTIAIKCPYISIEYKHSWIKEVVIVFAGIRFDKPVQYIDGNEALAAVRRAEAADSSSSSSGGRTQAAAAPSRRRR